MITSLCNVWITITKSPRGPSGSYPGIFGRTVSIALRALVGTVLLENAFSEKNDLRNDTCNNGANKIPVTGFDTAPVSV